MANVEYMEREEYTGMVTLVMDDGADIAMRDEALYRMLNDILRPRLRRRFRTYAQQVSFTLDDALQDFFLYLRGDAKAPYAVFQTIKDVSAFDAWILTTFRNFVSKRACRGLRSVNRDTSNIVDISDDSTQERQFILSTMIAYCYQELPLVQRFVFLRLILTVLDRDRSLPQSDVAMVLNISHVYYRVMGNRVKSFMMHTKERLICGEELPLGPSALSMREALEHCSTSWYEVMEEYYSQTIGLFDQSEAINKLRISYGADSSGTVLHDKENPSNQYSPWKTSTLKNEINQLWIFFGVQLSPDLS